MVQTDVTVTKPQSGADLNTSDVEVDWTATNYDSSTQEFVIELDGEVVHTQKSYGVTLTGVPDGDHSVTVYTRESGAVTPK